MFLSAVIGLKGPTDGVVDSGIVKVETTAPNIAKFSFLGDKNGVTLTTIGLLDSETTKTVGGVFNKGRSIIGTIIVNTLALVILWMAVMAALSASKITGEAVKPIADMGHSVGELMKNAPQYVPIPGTNGQSMKSMTQ
jgi:malonyl CoA-acyl carrier protein transacylase